VVYGDGKQTRDFTYVDDVVDAFVVAASAEPANGEVINVCAGTEVSVLELLGVLSDLLQTDVEPVFEPPRTGEVRASQGYVGKAADVLGWSPQWTLRRGLERSMSALTYVPRPPHDPGALLVDAALRAPYDPLGWGGPQ
jgi:nucleoside-diphosphate-sugar epimerase